MAAGKYQITKRLSETALFSPTSAEFPKLSKKNLQSMGCKKFKNGPTYLISYSTLHGFHHHSATGVAPSRSRALANSLSTVSNLRAENKLDLYKPRTALYATLESDLSDFSQSKKI